MTGRLFFWFLRCAVALSLLLLPLGGPFAATDSGSSRVDLTILFINDLHGHILPQSSADNDGVEAKRAVGGAAHLARMIDNERAQNPDGTLLLAAGDLFQGTPISNVFYGQPVLDVLNALHFDATAVGNHEFDWGLSKLQELASTARFPFLAANIVDRTGQQPRGLKAYAMVRRKGLQIALIGLTTPDTPFSTKPDHVAGLNFLNPEKALRPLIADLRAKGADLIMVLSHLGLDEDRGLAQRVSGIDVVIGGHTHTAVTKALEVNHTLIVQAKCYGEYLGVLRIKIDKNSKQVVEHNQRVLKKVSSGPGDPFEAAMDQLVQRHYARIKEHFSAVIGETRIDLNRSVQGESLLGDVICDAVRQAAHADIAFQNAGGIRADLPKGRITLEQIYTTLPFDNQLIAMSLTGAQIRDILERSLHRDGSVGLQVSGLRVSYNLQRPFGSRVVDVVVNGQPLDAEKTYRIATNDFLAAGGDRFGYFKNGREIVYHGDFRDAVTDYFRAQSPLTLRLDGRIWFASAEQTEKR